MGRRKDQGTMTTNTTVDTAAGWTEHDSRIARLMATGGDEEGIPLGPNAVLRLLDALVVAQTEAARCTALLNALCSLGVAFGDDDDDAFRRCAAAGLAAWAIGKDGAAAVDEAVDKEARTAPEPLAPPRSVSRVGEWVYIDRSVPVPSDVRTGTLRDIWPDGTATVDLDRKSGTVTVPYDKIELYIPF